MSSYSFQGLKRVWTPRDEEENRAIFSAMPQHTGIKMPNEFKPVYLENAEYAVEKWSLKQLIRVLRLYGSHRCLWDVRDPDNKNRKLRKAAMLDITAAMGDGMTMEQVLQKINVLRGTYRYEKRRIKQRMRKGLGATTKLKWFALADAFLRNVPRSEKLRKTTEHVDSDSDLEDSVVFAINPEILMPLQEDNAGTQNQIIENAKKINTQDSVIMDNIAQTSYSPVPSPSSAHQESSIAESEESQARAVTDTSTSVDSKDPRTLLKRPWTSLESVLFVELLSQQPILWQSNSGDSCQSEFSESYDKALQNIASLMVMSVQRITRRLRIFKHAYAEEKHKTSLDPSYKSNFIWFSFADHLMEANVLQATNFVDTNLLPPPTPNIKFDSVEIKKEQSDCESEYQAATPINPINSVASSSSIREASQNEALEYLFNNTQATESHASIKTEHCQKSPEPNDANPADTVGGVVEQNATIVQPSTKLVWNGLEEDLLEGKWLLKHSVKFLRLYGSHRCLWDLNDCNYRSRVLRNAAIEDIAAAMGHGLNADYVAKKIKIFRITYMQHRKRMLEACKEGKPEPEVQLRWFPLADSFLRPHIGLRSIKEHEHEIPQFDFQYAYANLNLIDPALLTDFVGKGTQNSIKIGTNDAEMQLYTRKDTIGEVTQGCNAKGKTDQTQLNMAWEETN